jgi:hypothetical protein
MLFKAVCTIGAQIITPEHRADRKEIVDGAQHWMDLGRPASRIFRPGEMIDGNLLTEEDIEKLLAAGAITPVQ